jgi:hypothetical protein
LVELNDHNCNRPALSPSWQAYRKDTEGLDLYGGTRHTTTTEIAKHEGKDAAKRHSGHRTNKAFDRYCQMDEQESSDMAQRVIRKRMRADVLELKKKAK